MTRDQTIREAEQWLERMSIHYPLSIEARQIIRNLLALLTSPGPPDEAWAQVRRWLSPLGQADLDAAIDATEAAHRAEVARLTTERDEARRAANHEAYLGDKARQERDAAETALSEARARLQARDKA